MSSSKDQVRQYLCVLARQGTRVFSEEDLVPCTARMSRQEARHYLDELEWDGDISRTIGKPGHWRVTEEFHTAVTQGVTAPVTERENHPDLEDNASGVT
jgi:hypothetical protein